MAVNCNLQPLPEEVWLSRGTPSTQFNDLVGFGLKQKKDIPLFCIIQKAIEEGLIDVTTALNGIFPYRGELAAGSDLTANATGNAYLDGSITMLAGDTFLITSSGNLTVSDGTVAVTNGDLAIINTDTTDAGIVIAEVDVQGSVIDSIDKVLSVGNASGGTDLVMSGGDKITVDTIDETTANAGVTIDSWKIKDGGAGVIIGGTNTFNITNGTADFDIAAGVSLDVDTSCTIDQDLQQTASPTFANLTITSMAGNWTNAGRTVADLGIITTVDINGGVADGLTIGGAVPAAGTFTTLVANTSLDINGSTVVTSILDEDAMGSDSDVALATQQSIKAYVDAQIAGSNSLQEAFDVAPGIIVANTDNQTLALTQNDTTNNPNAFNITNTGTGVSLFLDHDDTGTGATIDVDRDGNNASNLTAVIVNAANAGAGLAIGLHVQSGLFVAAETSALQGAVNIGVDDTSEGVLTLAGNATGNDEGGYISLQTAEDFDTTITDFRIQANQDDLWFGTSVTPTSLSYTGANNTWNFLEDVTFAGVNIDDLGTVTTADINGGTIDATSIGATTPAIITGTTIDATTDFTVGGTVITDGDIQDDGALSIDAVTSVIIEGGVLNVGVEDGAEGVLTLYGEATGSTDGGWLSWETAEDHDTTITAFVAQAFEDDFWIGPSTTLNSLEYTGADNTWNFNEDVTFAGVNIDDLGTVVTANIDGGTIDGTIIGGAAAAAITGTAIVGTSLNDGTVTLTSGTVTGTWTDLGSVTTVDINGGTIDGTAIGSSVPSTVVATTVFAASGVQHGSVSVTATGAGANIPNTASFIVQGTTTDANDILVLPAAGAGAKFLIWTNGTGCELRTVAASSETINNVDCDGTNELALAANSLFEVIGVSGTGYIARGWDNVGADLAALVPDAA